MIPEQQEEVVIGSPSLAPLVEIGSGTTEISFNFTNGAIKASGSHAWTFANDSEFRPSVSRELVVTDTTTITTPADAAFFSTQTLSALAPGTYKVIIFRLTEDATKNYGIAVGVKQ